MQVHHAGTANPGRTRTRQACQPHSPSPSASKFSCHMSTLSSAVSPTSPVRASPVAVHRQQLPVQTVVQSSQLRSTVSP
jgi:hypothetical protein